MNFAHFLTTAYTMVLVLSNWFNPRLVHLFGLDTDSGTLIFPLTFILSDIITEVYGFGQARRAIWCGFFFNAFFVLYGFLVLSLPSPAFANNNHLFESLFALSTRTVAASLISYLLAEPLNSFLGARFKVRLKGRMMGARFLASTAIAAGLDSVTFSLLAFYGVIPAGELLSLILTMWGVKVAVEALLLPFTTRLAKWLKNREKMDIYDEGAAFRLFSLQLQEKGSQNRFANS